MVETKKPKKVGPRVESRLNSVDLARLDSAARLAGATRSEMARTAILWYLDNQEKLTNDDREAQVAQAIRYATDQIIKAIRQGVDRICKMLARQGVAIGTLYELSYMALPDDELAVQAFQAASTTAKQKMRRNVEQDEAELAEAMKKVANA